ncbi:MAG: DNA gyrase C-terminal beta-propeller domain-containing protein, partial [Gammaproteobacteria bacterium]
VQVQETDGIMLISDQGTLVRTQVDEVSCLGRNTQGVVLIRLGGDEHLVGIERVDAWEEEEDELVLDVNGSDDAGADDAGAGNAGAGNAADSTGVDRAEDDDADDANSDVNSESE